MNYELGQNFELRHGQTKQNANEQMSITLTEIKNGTVSLLIHSDKMGPMGAEAAMELSEEKNSIIVFSKYTLFLEAQKDGTATFMIGLIP